MKKKSAFITHKKINKIKRNNNESTNSTLTSSSSNSWKIKKKLKLVIISFFSSLDKRLNQ